MLKIFSISEIINASNKILEVEQEDAEKLIVNDSLIKSKNTDIATSFNDLKEENFSKKSKPKDIQNIIIEAESAQTQDKISKFTKKFKDENKHTSEKFTVNKDELIESMYRSFSKKIKKNTLKLILDLKEEIIFLTKNIISLEEKKKKKDIIKKKLKKNIIDLKYRENELKHDLKKIQANFTLLNEQHKNLNIEHTSLKEQQKNLNIEHTSLKEQYKNLNIEHTSLKEQHKNLNIKHTSLKEQYKNLDLDHMLLINQNTFLKNDNRKINSQLDIYKDNEIVSKSKIEKLEKEILINNKLLNETNEDNRKINSQFIEISQYKENEEELREKNINLEKKLDNLKLTLNNNDQRTSITDLENKIKHYQEENIRISSAFHESNKKFEITKESLNNLQKHKSGLIEKINSINEVIQNENIVTNVFQGDLGKDKIKVIDSDKPAVKKKIDINQEIKNIFSKN